MGHSSTLLYLLDLFGVTVFAATGAIVAARKRRHCHRYGHRRKLSAVAT
jgi:hypothetical protein